MTLFEYLAAGYVLMLSFAVLRAVSGVPYAVASSGRYWVHIFWLTTSLGICLIAFWAFWSYREVEWTIFRFMRSLAVPALAYAYVSLLVPPDPAAVESWRDYFFDVRIPLFSTSVALQSMVVINVHADLGLSLFQPPLVGNLVHVALSVIGVASARPRVHAAMALAYGLLLPGYFVLVSDPNSVVPTGP